MLFFFDSIKVSALQVCAHILHCFETAARFESCREKISELPTVFSNICRLLQFNVSYFISLYVTCNFANVYSMYFSRNAFESHVLQLIAFVHFLYVRFFKCNFFKLVLFGNCYRIFFDMIILLMKEVAYLAFYCFHFIFLRF